MRQRLHLPPTPPAPMPGNPTWKGFAGVAPAGQEQQTTVRPKPGMKASNGAVFTLGWFVFLLSSIVYQIMGSYLGLTAPYVAIGFGVVFLAYLFAGGHYLRFAKSPLFLPWMGIMFAWTMASIFGAYPRRSLSYLVEYLMRIHSLPIIVCAIAVTLRSVRMLMLWGGAGLVALLLFCYKYGQMYYDRFVIPDTTLANGNDLALHILLFGCMFLAFSRAGKFGIFLTVLVVPVSIYYVLRTASRGNMVTLGLLVVVSFLVIPARKKLYLLIGSVLLAALAIPVLPRQTLNRLQTFTSSATEGASELEEGDYTQNAVDSTKARINLQRRAIQLTMRHPVFGVGPLNFSDEVDRMVRETEGHKSGWQVSHDSYLDVSSETGLVGAFFYVWAIFGCLFMNYKSYKLALLHPEIKDGSILAFSALLMTVTYAFGTLFCSIAYDYYLALVVSITAAVYLALRQEILVLSPKPAHVGPAPFTMRPVRPLGAP